MIIIIGAITLNTTARISFLIITWTLCILYVGTDLKRMWNNFVQIALITTTPQIKWQGSQIDIYIKQKPSISPLPQHLLAI